MITENVPRQGNGHREVSQNEVPPAATKPRLGEILLKRGLITGPQLREALLAQAALQAYKPLGQILVDQQAIATPQLNPVLDVYHKRARLGEILLKTGAIVSNQLAFALEHQRVTELRLRETLLQLNYITEEHMRWALCLQLNITFLTRSAFAFASMACSRIRTSVCWKRR